MPWSAVEVQLPGDLFLLSGVSDGVEHEIHGLICSGCVADNVVIKQIPNDGKVHNALCRMDVRNIGSPTSD